MVRRDGRFEVVFDLNLGRLRAFGFDQIGDINPARGVQDSRQAFLLSSFPGPLAAANTIVICANTPTGELN